jgi:prepilin signal peptidase PulO-like enzyme (type II secretory pathway)
MASLFACAYTYIGSAYIGWTAGFILIIGFLIAVDQQYFLLPDFFTIPLLFLGFGFATFTGMLSPSASFFGALFGYFLCTLSVWVMNLIFKRAEFGAGDVKMVTALGAWLGYESLNIALILSFVFFAAYASIVRKKSGAFGPALGMAAIIMLFIAYAK